MITVEYVRNLRETLKKNFVRNMRKLATMERLAADFETLSQDIVEPRDFVSIHLTSHDVVERVVSVVSEHLKISPAAIFFGGRTEPEVFARHLSMRLSCEFIRNQSEVARVFKMDHGTILHGVRAMNARIETNQSVAVEFATLRKHLVVEFSNERTTTKLEAA